MPFDPYAVLGVGRDADDAAIKRAHRGGVKRTHPDAGGDAEEFADVQRAFLVLSDPKKRSKYDRTGTVDDDKAGQHPDVEALQIIGRLIGSILFHADIGFDQDLAGGILRALEIEIGEHKKKIAATETALKRAEWLRGRFTPRKRGENRIESIIEWHRRQLEAAIAGHKHMVAQSKRAQEIIADYDFRADPQMSRLSDLSGLSSSYGSLF